LFNKSKECGEYPECSKISQIVPVPKCATSSKPSHCRPISILPTVSKIFERIIHDRLSDFQQTFDTDLETIHQQLYLPFMKNIWKIWIRAKHVRYYS